MAFVEIALPEADKLREILDKVGLANLDKRMDFAEEFGGKKVTPLSFVDDLTTVLYAYGESLTLEDEHNTPSLRTSEKRLLQVIFIDHPETIKFLKEKQLI